MNTYQDDYEVRDSNWHRRYIVLKERVEARVLELPDSIEKRQMLEWLRYQ